MTSTRCPQCSATMRPVAIGRLEDKFLECSHCGHRIDVADEVTIEEASTSAGTDDRGRQVTVTTKKVISRRDLSPAGEDPLRASHRGPEEGLIVDGVVDPGELRSRIRDLLGDALPEGFDLDLPAHGLGLGDGADLRAMLEELGAGKNERLTTTHTVTRTVVGGGPVAGVETGLGGAGSARRRTSSSARKNAPAAGVNVPVWLIAVVVTLVVMLALIALT